MRTTFNRNPPLQQQCEVCRAARALQLATDVLHTFLALGGTPGRDDARMVAVKQATIAWDYARGGRHTGAQHTPVVVG